MICNQGYKGYIPTFGVQNKAWLCPHHPNCTREPYDFCGSLGNSTGMTAVGKLEEPILRDPNSQFGPRVGPHTTSSIYELIL